MGKKRKHTVQSEMRFLIPIREHSLKVTHLLKDNHVAISMDGRGHCQDNIFVERLWWTLKHPLIYPHSFEDGRSLQRGLAKWIQSAIFSS